MLMPASAAARMTDVPSGTIHSTPSMVSDTVLLLVEAGVPRSRSRWTMVSSMLDSGCQAPLAADCEDLAKPKSSGKCSSADRTGYGVMPPRAHSEPPKIGRAHV